jgi:hypothetical protein
VANRGRVLDQSAGNACTGKSRYIGSRRVQRGFDHFVTHAMLKAAPNFKAQIRKGYFALLDYHGRRVRYRGAEGDVAPGVSGKIGGLRSPTIAS